MGTLSSTYNLRDDIARMNDVADFVDSFDDSAWTGWTPTISVVAPMTISAITSNGFYLRVGSFVFVRLRFSCTLGGTLSTLIQVTTPIDPNIGTLGLETPMLCQIVNTGTRLGYGVTQGAFTPRRFDVRRFDGANFVAGSCAVSLSGYYPAAV